jgi:hypothetical protein
MVISRDDRRPVGSFVSDMIPVQEFNAALAGLELQSPQVYRARYGDSCWVCVESPASRHLLLTMLSYMGELQRAGGDVTIPLVLLAGTMLQTGYAIGRKRAEAEVLEGWMTL